MTDNKSRKQLFSYLQKKGVYDNEDTFNKEMDTEEGRKALYDQMYQGGAAIKWEDFDRNLRPELAEAAENRTEQAEKTAEVKPTGEATVSGTENMPTPTTPKGKTSATGTSVTTTKKTAASAGTTVPASSKPVSTPTEATKDTIASVSSESEPLTIKNADVKPDGGLNEFMEEAYWQSPQAAKLKKDTHEFFNTSLIGRADEFIKYGESRAEKFKEEASRSHNFESVYAVAEANAKAEWAKDPQKVIDNFNKILGIKPVDSSVKNGVLTKNEKKYTVRNGYVVGTPEQEALQHFVLKQLGLPTNTFDDGAEGEKAVAPLSDEQQKEWMRMYNDEMNHVVTCIQEELRNYLIEREMPQSWYDYVLSGAFKDSTIGAIKSIIMDKAAKNSGFRLAMMEGMENMTVKDYVTSEAERRYLDKLGFWSRALLSGARGATSMIIDAPVFALGGAGSATAAAKVGNWVGMKFGSKLAANVAARVVSGGMTFGGYDLIQEGLSQIASDKLDTGALLGSYAKGFATGGVLGASNAAVDRYAQKMLDRGSRMAAYAVHGAGYAAEVGLFTGTEVAAESSLNGEFIGWDKTFEILGKQGVLIGLLKGKGKLEQVYDRVQTAKKINEALGLDSNNLQELKDAGYDDDKIRMMIAGQKVKPTDFKPNAEVKAPNDKSYFENVAEEERADLIKKMMADPSVSWDTKQKMMQALTGYIMPDVPAAGVAVNTDDKGNKQILVKDASGNVISRKYVADENLASELNKAHNRVRVSQVAQMEDALMNCATQLPSAIEKVAKDNHMSYDRIVECLRAEEQGNAEGWQHKIAEQVRNTSRTLAIQENIYEGAARIKSEVEEHTGVDLDIAMSHNNPSTAQMEAMDMYISRLNEKCEELSEHNDWVNEQAKATAEAQRQVEAVADRLRPYADEQGKIKTAVVDGKQVYIANETDDFYFVTDDNGDAPVGVSKDKASNVTELDFDGEMAAVSSQTVEEALGKLENRKMGLHEETPTKYTAGQPIEMGGADGKPVNAFVTGVDANGLVTYQTTNEKGEVTGVGQTDADALKRMQSEFFKARDRAKEKSEREGIVYSPEWAMAEKRKEEDAMAKAQEDWAAKAVAFGKSLSTEVKVFHTLQEVIDEYGSESEQAQRCKERLNRRTGKVISPAKGWYDIDGTVGLFVPAGKSEKDMKQTILHEIVGHSGIPSLLIDGWEGMNNAERAKARTALFTELYDQLGDKQRTEVEEMANAKYSGDIVEATDEYLATTAEKDEIPSWFGKVAGAIRTGLRDKGYVAETDGDILYLLWRSRMAKMGEGDGFFGSVQDMAMRLKLGIDRMRGGKQESRAEEQAPTKEVEPTASSEPGVKEEAPSEEAVPSEGAIPTEPQAAEDNTTIPEASEPEPAIAPADAVSAGAVFATKTSNGTDVRVEIGATDTDGRVELKIFTEGNDTPYVEYRTMEEVQELVSMDGVSLIKPAPVKEAAPTEEVIPAEPQAATNDVTTVPGSSEPEPKPASAYDLIPTDENGRKDYAKATVDETWNALQERYGDDAKLMAEEALSMAETEAEKMKKSGDIDAYGDAYRKVKYWKGVNDTVNRRIEAERQEAARKEAVDAVDNIINNGLNPDDAHVLTTFGLVEKTMREEIEHEQDPYKKQAMSDYWNSISEELMPAYNREYWNTALAMRTKGGKVSVKTVLDDLDPEVGEDMLLDLGVDLDYNLGMNASWAGFKQSNAYKIMTKENRTDIADVLDMVAAENKAKREEYRKKKEAEASRMREGEEDKKKKANTTDGTGSMVAPVRERPTVIASQTSSDTLEQDSKGQSSGIDTFAHLVPRAKVRFRDEDAKEILNKNTIESYRKVQKAVNEDKLGKEEMHTPVSLVRKLATLIGMQRSKSTFSFYRTYDVAGTPVEMRVSSHPLNGKNLRKADAEKAISLVIYKDGEHKGGQEIPFEEYIHYVPDGDYVKVGNDILRGVGEFLDTGDYPNYAKGEKFTYSMDEYEDANTRFREEDGYEKKMKVIDDYLWGGKLTLTNWELEDMEFRLKEKVSILNARMDIEYEDWLEKNGMEDSTANRYKWGDSDETRELRRILSRTEQQYFRVIDAEHKKVEDDWNRMMARPIEEDYRRMDEERGIDHKLHMRKVREGWTPYRIAKREKETLDRSYLRAIQDGDMEKAQRMVDEAAEKAGYNPIAYQNEGDGNIYGHHSNYKNDRKLLDTITYDDKGNVIPLSKRFNFRRSDVRYRDDENGNDDKKLYGVHNLTEENLLHAVKMGGLANPSTAVVRIDRDGLNSFGDISLLMPPSMIEKKSGRNAGTWSADAYSPRYPRDAVRGDMSSKGQDKFNKDIETASDNEKMRREIRDGWSQYIIHNDKRDALYYWYLEDKGLNPEKVMEKPVELKSLDKAMIDATGGKEWTELTDGDKDKLRLCYADNIMSVIEPAFRDMLEKGDITKEEYKEKIVKFRKEEADGIKESGLFNLYGNAYARFKRSQKELGVDSYNTAFNARKRVQDEGLEKDFNDWLDGKKQEYEVTESVFDGFDSEGYRKYRPHTLANISRMMKKSGKAGAEELFTTSPGALRAKIAPIYGKLDDIRKNKDRIISSDEFEKIKEQISEEFFDLSALVRGKMGGDEGFYRLEEAMKHGAEWLNKNYSDIDLDKEDIERIEAFRTFLKEAPTEYFETKFERPVMLNEFVGAVVPKTMGDKARKALEEAGLKLYDYDPDIEGDRQKVTIEATEAENIRFRDDEEEKKEKPRLYNGLYSNAEKAVIDIKQNKATADQWLSMLKNNGGLKEGEDKWIGLSDWLRERKGSVTKEEILDYIRKNSIDIEEFRYGDIDIDSNKKMQGLREEFNELLADAEEETGSIYTRDLEDWAYEKMVERYGDDFRMAFDVADGTLIPSEDWGGDISEAAMFYLDEDDVDKPINGTRLHYTTEGLTNKREIALTVPSIESWNVGDAIHFGDAGYGTAVAWCRFGDTTDADGNRVLVIDEVQSKRHQEGREKGYKKAVPDFIPGNEVEKSIKSYIDLLTNDGYPLEEAFGYAYNQISDAPEEAKGWTYEAVDKVRKAMNPNEDGVPDAPFDRNWHELVMKRMVHYAAENGYDKVAWTSGDQQAERYGIGDAVERIISYDYPETADSNGRKSKKIEIRLNGNETMTMRVDSDGNIIEGRNNTEGTTLNAIVGKDLANRILSGDGEDATIFDANRDLPAKVIKGEGLRIGGEGMKGFYDKMLPSFMNKFGKKFGAKVSVIDLPDLEESAQKMWSIDVTPEMKRTAMDEGFPMFREGEERDKEYEEAVKAGDKKKVDAMLREEARRKGYSDNRDYQGSLAFNGAAPSSNAYFKTKDERKEAFDNEEFEGDASLGDFMDNGIEMGDLEWQLTNPTAIRIANKAKAESIVNLRNVVKEKRRTIKMYRAVDADIKEDSFRNGDWITPSKEYAKEHIELQDWKKGRIIEQYVSVDDVWWDGNDINEWGYDDGKEYAYKNTENNRKLLEATYDNNGNLIPLSKRFTDSENDVRFRDDEEPLSENTSTFAHDRETFDERQKRAVKENGIVLRGLNEASIKIIKDEPLPFKARVNDAMEWAKKNLITSSNDVKDGNLPTMADGTPYEISKKSVEKYLSGGAFGKTLNNGVPAELHYAVLAKLRDIIKNSVDAEIHPDYKKVDGTRSVDNGYNDNMLVHRMYGALEHGEDIYRVKVTMHEYRGNENNRPHSYEVTKIELLNGTSQPRQTTQRKTSIGDVANNNSISVAKLLQNVEKSYDKGRKLLDESKNVQSNGSRFRDGEDSNKVKAPEREKDESIFDYAERMDKWHKEHAAIAQAEAQTDTNPTDGQKEAGNYRKGKCTIDSMTISVENPKGSTRSGVDANGKKWSVTMNNTYGYILGTEGVDGDHIDVFLSDDPTAGRVFVVDQVNDDGSFDEHKVMYGFNSEEEAKKAYLSNYSKGWKGLGKITEVSKEDFKKWISSSHRKTKPFAEYKIFMNKYGARFRDEEESYETAYKDKDEEKAFDIVREAAAKTFPDTKVVDKDGKPLVVYHGTQLMEMYFKDGHPYTKYTDRFNTFMEGKGFFTNDKDAAKSFARGKQGLYEAYLDIKNPFILDCKGHDWDMIEDYENKDGYKYVTTDYIVNDIKRNHPEYDGVILRNVMSENSGSVKHPINDYIPFKPEQIKSAEPFTYDDSGKLISLSERFNPSNGDIRFRWIGEEGAEREDRSEGNTDRMDGLKVAKRMAKRNKTDKSIKLATGWERGADGKWRYEEGAINFNEEALQKVLSKDSDYFPITDIIDDDELIAAYPRLKRIHFSNKVNDTAAGSYSYWDNVLNVDMSDLIEKKKELKMWERKLAESRKLASRNFDEDTVRNAKDWDLDLEQEAMDAEKDIPMYEGLVANTKELIERLYTDYKSTLNHEIQHFIQYEEGWAMGGSPRTVRNYLKNLQDITEEPYQQREWIETHSDIVGIKYDLDRAMTLFRNPKRFLRMGDHFKYSGSKEELIRTGQELAVDGYLRAVDQLEIYADAYDLNLKDYGIDIEELNNKVQSLYKMGYSPADIAKRGIAAPQMKKFYADVERLSAKDAKGAHKAVNDYDKLQSDLTKLLDRELYSRLAGEVEARNASARMDFTKAERRNSLASETEDVQRGDQIVVNPTIGISYGTRFRDDEGSDTADEQIGDKIGGTWKVGKDGRFTWHEDNEEQFVRKNRRSKTIGARAQALLDEGTSSWQEQVKLMLAGTKMRGEDKESGTKGLISHTTGNRKDIANWCAKKGDVDALTPEELAEKIQAELPEGIRENVSDQDVFNEIIDTVMSYNTHKALIDDLERVRFEQETEGMAEYEKEQADAYARERGFDSWDEYTSYEGYVEAEGERLRKAARDRYLRRLGYDGEEGYVREMSRFSRIQRAEARKRRQKEIKEELLAMVHQAEQRPIVPVRKKGESVFDYAERVGAYQEAQRKYDESHPVEAMNRDDAMRAVRELVNEQLDRDSVSEMDKRTLNSILRTLASTNVVNLDARLEEAKRLVQRIKVRANQSDIQRMLDLKVKDVNGKNMNVAKNVDDDTRRIMERLKGSVLDVQDSGLEDRIHDLRSENWRLREILRSKDVKADTQDIIDRIDANNKQIESLNEERKRILAKKARSGEINVEKAINDLQAKMDKDAENGNIDNNDVIDMTALTLQKLLLDSNAEDINVIELESKLAAVRRAKKMLYGKYESRLKEAKQAVDEEPSHDNLMKWQEVSKEYAEQRDRLINMENGLNRIINEAQANKMDIQEALYEQLKNVVDGGKDSLKTILANQQQRRLAIMHDCFEDITGTGERAKPSDIDNDSNKKEKWYKSAFTAALSSFEYMAQNIATRSLGKDGKFYRQFVSGKDGVISANNTYIVGMRNARERLDEKVAETFKDWKPETRTRKRDKYGRFIWNGLRGDGKDLDRIETFADWWQVMDMQPVEGEWGKRHNVFVNGVPATTGVTVLDMTDLDNEGKPNGSRLEIKDMSKGQATYIYQLWKMNDGRGKLELMGFDDASMEQVADYIGAENMRMADWIQDEYLQEMREKYNSRYKEIYNTSMAAIENYVPIKINSGEVMEKIDLTGDTGNGAGKLVVKTGALINRTANDKSIDRSWSAAHVLWDHLDKMEEFYAFSPVRRDLSYVFGSQFFRNQLNKNSHGAFDRLVKAAEVAVHAERDNGGDEMDKVFATIQKGLVGGNIAFRNNTALKQMLSAPAFIGYSQDPEFLASLALNMGKIYLGNSKALATVMATFGAKGKDIFDNTAKGKGNFLTRLTDDVKWCLDNVPDFYERVLKGSAGDSRLDEKGMENVIGRFIDKYMEQGMRSNQMVDALTCAIGIKTIYDYKMKKADRRIERDLEKLPTSMTKEEIEDWKKKEREEEHRQAIMEATIYYNGTQQSNHKAFLSPLQVSRGFLQRSASLYQNASIGFARRFTNACIDLYRMRNWNKINEDYTRRLLEEKGYKKDDVVPDKVRKETEEEANKYLRNEMRKRVVEVGLYGFVINFLWDMGGKGLLGLFRNKDEEEQDKDVWDDITYLATLPGRGTTGMNLITGVLSGQRPEIGLHTSEIGKFIDNYKKAQEEYGIISPEVAYVVMERAARFGGIDLNTWTNTYLGVERLVRDGYKLFDVSDPTGKADMIVDLMLAIQSPESQRAAVAKRLYTEKYKAMYPTEEEFRAHLGECIEDYIKDVTRAMKYVQEGDTWESWLPSTKILKEQQENSLRKEFIERNLTEEERKQYEDFKEFKKEVKGLPDLASAQKLFRDTKEEGRREMIISKMRTLAKQDEGDKGVEDEIATMLGVKAADNEEWKKIYITEENDNDAFEDIRLNQKMKEMKAVNDELNKLAKKDEGAADKYEKEHEEELNRFWEFSDIVADLREKKLKLGDIDLTDEDRKEVWKSIRALRRRALQY